jgi:hypothetical protein
MTVIAILLLCTRQKQEGYDDTDDDGEIPFLLRWTVLKNSKIYYLII